MSRLKITRALGAVAALALAGPLLASIPAAAEDPVSGPPVTVWAPTKVTAYAYRSNRTWTDLGVRLIANDAPFEIWSQRPSYSEPISTVWRSAAGDVALPEQPDFSGLRKFFSITIDPHRQGADTFTRTRPGCLFGYGQRVRPDAPASSDYPYGCWYNAYSIGSVQGIQTGWASPVLADSRPFPIGPGRYTVTVRLTRGYAAALGLSDAQRTRTIELTVVDESGLKLERTATSAASGTSKVAQPADSPPSGAPRLAVDGPKPDLRTLPAWGISITGGGNALAFAATVWNGGNSPLVVDGFRREDEEVMDAYQYFFDSDGNQTGYQQVGTMEWDARPSHHHWHFEDFARYTLVDRDKNEVVRSTKEAFCLANTDAVDLTVPDAEWRPENSDLGTACGDESALSVREVLASGWGDSYVQYRAGQSFRLAGVPNGVYFIKVEANPERNLVESRTGNNVSYRKVRIGGTPDHRTVRVAQVGMIQDEGYGGKG